MRSARAGGHAAVRLLDGRVPVAGGWAGSTVTASAERYDPATGQFTPTGSMGTARANMAAALLPDGSVLVADGYDGRVALDNAEIYDPVAGTFGPTGRLTVPRAGLASATLPGGRVLLAGGGSTDGLSASAEVYDPRTGEFGPTGSMSMVRYKLAAAALPDGRVLVLGGSDDRDWTGQYRSAELYDPATRQFSPTGSMRAARFKIEAATLPTGAVVVAGSDRSLESYDPAVGTFITATGEVADEYQSATATALADGRVLIAGGYDPSIDTTASTWLFRP